MERTENNESYEETNITYFILTVGGLPDTTDNFWVKNDVLG